MRSPWMHLAIWIALLALVVAGRWVWSQRDQWLGQGLQTTQTAIHSRAATVDEWQLSIAELGRRGLGKRLLWRALQDRDHPADGILVWWHDGRTERLGYHPAPTEDGQRAVMSLMRGLYERRIVLYDAHGDPELFTRIFSGIDANWALPPGLTILSPPPLPTLPTDTH